MCGPHRLLTNSVTGGEWRTSDLHIATINAHGLLTGLSTGQDTVIYTVTNTCGMAKSSYLVNVALLTMGCYPTTVDANAADAMDIKFYPNPTRGNFNVVWNAPTDETAAVTLTNIMGQKVMAFMIGTNKETTINADLPSGVYMIMVEAKEGSYTGRLVFVR